MKLKILVLAVMLALPRASDAKVVVVSETAVNDATWVDGNSSPSIAPLGGGSFIVSWHEWWPTSGSGRIYGAGGVAAGSKFSLNRGGPGGFQYGHVVAALKGGGIAAFWGDYGNGTWGQTFLAGNPTSSAVQVLGIDWPAATALPDGNIVVNATFPNGLGGPVEVAILTPALKQVNSFNANVNPPQIGLGPSVAAAPNGNFAVAWNNLTGAAIVRFFDKTGKALTGEIIANSPPSLSSDSPSMAFDRASNLWLAWHGGTPTGDNIFMQEFNDKFVPVGSQIQVNATNLTSNGLPQLAVRPDGEVAVSWTATVSGVQGVYAAIFRNGKVLEPTFRVNQSQGGIHRTGWAGGRHGTWISGNNAYFAWVGHGAQGYGVYLTVFRIP